MSGFACSLQFAKNVARPLIQSTQRANNANAIKRNIPTLSNITLTNQHPYPYPHPHQHPHSTMTLQSFHLDGRFSNQQRYFTVAATATATATTTAIPNESIISSAVTDEEDYPPGWELIHSPPIKGKYPRGSLIGKVVSDKMQKTVNVAVDRYRMVPKYRKRLKYTRKFMAHDEDEECNMGDLVLISPGRKRSKMKHFEVQDILRRKPQL